MSPESTCQEKRSCTSQHKLRVPFLSCVPVTTCCGVMTVDGVCASVGADAGVSGSVGASVGAAGDAGNRASPPRESFSLEKHHLEQNPESPLLPSSLSDYIQ